MMNLQTELDALSKRIASFSAPPSVSDQHWAKFAQNTVVALMAGGESSRYAAVLNGKKVNKNAHELPNGDTMVEMTIRAYRDAGIKRFVALVFHQAHTIEDRLGDGTDMGVEIIYSHDPEQPVGKGGAVRNALENGSVPEDANLIVVNPDDIVLGFPGSYVRYIGEAFIEGEKKGMLATVPVSPGIPYPGTGLMISNNQVVDTHMYPLVPIPMHAGMTLFSPKIFPRFYELFNLKEKNDFENILFPLLASEKKLWSVMLDKGTWIQVNDLKSYKQLVDLLEK